MARSVEVSGSLSMTVRHGADPHGDGRDQHQTRQVGRGDADGGADEHGREDGTTRNAESENA